MTDMAYPTLRVWCVACEGQGAVLEERVAIVHESAQAMMVERTCQWCDGTGRRRGLQPPV